MSGSTLPETGIGSTVDIVSRIRAVMPASWFPLTAPDATDSATPVLDGLLNGIGQAWSFCYGLTVFVSQQTRIATATGGFLDMIAADLFGDVIKRNLNETDPTFRSRIQANLLLPRATRDALSQTMLTLLGETPLIFEPSRAADTGGYGGGSSPTAGGGGGYGSPGLAQGSGSMPFQFLLAVSGGAAWTRRESDASYIDANNMMQIASRRLLRPAFTNGIATGSLIETRGFNLIKDSIGWTGWSLSASSATCTWSIDQTGDGVLLEAQAALRLNISGVGSFNGPSITIPLVTGPVVGSLWIKVPNEPGLQSLTLIVVDETGTNRTSVDLTVTEIWQRVSVGTLVPANFTRPISIQLAGQSVSALEEAVLTQCWQVEPGLEATSYIPSSEQIGIREADDVILLPAETASTVNSYSLNEAICRVIPAGSIAWTTLVI